MIRTKLFFVAATGTLASWLLVRTFIEMSFLQFLATEFIVGFSHYIYNDVKSKLTT